MNVLVRFNSNSEDDKTNGVLNFDMVSRKYGMGDGERGNPHPVKVKGAQQLGWHEIKTAAAAQQQLICSFFLYTEK